MSGSSDAAAASSSFSPTREPLLRNEGDHQYTSLVDQGGTSKPTWLKRPRRPRCVRVLLMLSVLYLGVAIAGPYLAHYELHRQLDDQFMVDSESSPGYADWYDSDENSEREVHMYVFSVVNPNGFAMSGERLRVQENGPFVYRKRQRKIDAVFNLDGDFVDYRLWTQTEFDAARTFNLTQGKYNSDNVSFKVVDSFFWGQPPQTGYRVWKLLNGLGKNDTTRMFTSVSVRDLKNGYGACPLCFPGLMPTERVPANETYRTRIGRKDDRATGSYVKWRDMSDLEVECPWGNTTLGFRFCPESSCCGGKRPPWGEPKKGDTPEEGDPFAPNRVAGTDGNQFARGPHHWWEPLARSEESLPYHVVFIDFVWRHVAVKLMPEEPLEHHGVTLSKYHVDYNSSSSDSSKDFPFNAAYYMDGPRAMMNCTLVQRGAPIFFSNPHFLGVSPDATDRVNGLAPDPAHHDTILGVEPNSGHTMFARQRMQVNVRVEKVVFDDGTTWFQDMMPGATYVPLAWFDLVEHATPEKAAQLKVGLQQADALWKGSLALGATLSVACLIPAVILARRKDAPRGADSEGTKRG